MDGVGACGSSCGCRQHGVELNLSVKEHHVKRPTACVAGGSPGGIVCPAANVCLWREWAGGYYWGHRCSTPSHTHITLIFQSRSLLFTDYYTFSP